MPSGIYAHKSDSEETKAKKSKSAKEAWDKSDVRSKRTISIKIAVNKPEFLKKISGPNNYRWKGGLRAYLHTKARELFGTPICQDCGISLEDYIKVQKKKKFDMHCISKDYKILEQWNWKCLCASCHKKEQDRIR
jgi:hypothetical protein